MASVNSVQRYNMDTFFFTEETAEGQKEVEESLQKLPRNVVELVKSYMSRPKNTAPFCYRYDTNDFGIQVDRLRFSSYGREVFGPDMEELAQQLAFRLDYTTERYFPRDSFIRVEWQREQTGRTLFLQPESAALTIAIELVRRSADSRGKEACCFTSHPALGAGWSGSSKTRYFSQAVNDYAMIYPNAGALYSPAYFEGGNLCVVTHPRDPGRKICFEGHQSFMMCVLQLRRQQFFKKDNFIQTVAESEKRVSEIAATLTEDQVFKIAKEMYLLGILKFKSEVIPKFENNLVITPPLVISSLQVPRSDEEIQKVTEALKTELGNAVVLQEIHCRDAAAFDIPPEAKEWARRAAATFLNQQEVVKLLYGYLFKTRGDHRPQPEDIIVLPQLGFHLDMFMRPGPKGTIFLQDYALCRDLLIQIQEYADVFGLTEQDHAILEDYIQAAARLAEELKPIATEVLKTIQGAGFTVIPTPANFCDSATKFSINLMNAISGWSPSTGRYYYIVAGVAMGDELGRAIMHMFEKFLKLHVGNINVFFVGKSVGSPAGLRANFEAATKWCAESFSGIHCLTIETEVQSHLT